MLSLDEIHGVAEAGLKDELKSLGFDVSDRVGITMRRRSQNEADANA